MRVGLALLMVAAVTGVARADHTKEDAQATTRRLEAILHPPKSAAKHATATGKAAPARVEAARVEAARPTPVVDPLYSIFVHALAIPFDEQAREAHLRDIPTNAKEVDAHLRNIPKNAKELDAHLRRLDAALAAKHR
jgi:hypothetical protein